MSRRVSPRSWNCRWRTASRRVRARPVPRSASAPPVRCRHTVWGNSLRQRSNLRDAHRIFSCLMCCGVIHSPALPRTEHRRCLKAGTFSHLRSSLEDAHFFHTAVLLMPSAAQISSASMLQNCCAVEGGTAGTSHGVLGVVRCGGVSVRDSPFSKGLQRAWTIFRVTPIVRFAFVLRYLRQRPSSHVVILAAVVAAVACSVARNMASNLWSTACRRDRRTRPAYGWHSFSSCR